MSSKIFITGLDSFTGKYLAPLLEDSGHDIFGLVTKKESHYNTYSVYEGNLLDYDSIAYIVSEISPDYVVHLAGVSSVDNKNTGLIYNVNLIGTRNLLACLSDLKSPPKAILLASSANIYGNSSEGIIDEKISPKPANDYSVSKLAMEYMSTLFTKTLPIIIARPFNYTGVGQSETFLVPKIISHARRKAEVIELGNIDVSRDFSDVRMVVQCYETLLFEKNAIGKTFNVCSGAAFSIRNILSMVEDITNHHIDVKINTSLIRGNEVKFLRGDNSLLRSIIGKIPVYNFRDTLKGMIEA